MPELFAVQAARTPDRVALSDDAESLTFAELDRRSARLARLLAAHGAGPERIVAIALPRAASTFVAMLATLRAGAAYLPVDPGYPPAHVTAMLADAAPALLLTTSGLAGDLPREAGVRTVLLDRADLGAFAAGPVTDADRTAPLSPDHPAYVIYTSGSTGRPKGVVVTHRSVVNLFHSHRETLFRPTVRRTGRDALRVGHAWSFAFDASWQPQLWLFDGHAVHVVDDETRRDPERLAAVVGARAARLHRGHAVVPAADGRRRAVHRRPLPAGDRRGRRRGGAGRRSGHGCARWRTPRRSTCTARRSRRSTRWSPAPATARGRWSAGRSRTRGRTCWTPRCSRCRRASRASCTSAAPAWPAATCGGRG